jgi:IS30 family transposase
LSAINPFSVAQIIVYALKRYPVHTITCDNGFEFGHHKTIERLLHCRVYFTDVNSPQQRGSNENLNGLVREFFSKGVSMVHVSQIDADIAATRLNRRPRKRLNYDCPREVFARLVAKSPYRVR